MFTYLARARRAHNHSTELAHIEEVVMYAIWCFVSSGQVKPSQIDKGGDKMRLDTVPSVAASFEDVRVSEKLTARSTRDEISWSLYSSFNRSLRQLFLVAYVLEDNSSATQ